jgi:hypothetical protein
VHHPEEDHPDDELALPVLDLHSQLPSLLAKVPPPGGCEQTEREREKEKEGESERERERKRKKEREREREREREGSAIVLAATVYTSAKVHR